MGILTSPLRPTTKIIWCWLSVVVLWGLVFVVRRHSEVSFQELKHAAGDILGGPSWPSTPPSGGHHAEGPDHEAGDYEEPHHRHHQHQPQGPHARPDGPPRPQPWDPDSFKRAWLEADLGGAAFDGARLEEVCNGTAWRGDVVLRLLHSRGGLGNVRGTVLDFLHLALRAGAAHVVLPSYVKRADDTLDWMDESRGYWPFDNLFDADWLEGAVRRHCPQMTLHRTVEDAAAAHGGGAGLAEVAELYEPPRARTDKDPSQSLAATVAHFEAWLAAGPAGYDPARGPSLVSTRASLWMFDMLPAPRLRAALGRVLRINPRIRELAAAAVYAMRAAHGLEAAVDPREQYYEGAYYGMHLRTEQDATAIVHWDQEFGGFEQQTDAHLEKCKSLGLRVIYVASGNEEDIVRFAAKAKEQANIAVCSKRDLLTAPEDVAALDELTWDQHGALDWEVLSRSTFFSGPVMVSLSCERTLFLDLRPGRSIPQCPRSCVAWCLPRLERGVLTGQQSSFSWNIAMRRHFYLESERRLDNAYAIQEDVADVAFDDGLSRIMLKAHYDEIEHLAPRGMFP